VFLDLRRGEINDSTIRVSSEAQGEGNDPPGHVKGHQLHHLQNWKDIIEEAGLNASAKEQAALCSWLDSVLPTRIQTGEVQ